MHNFFFAIAWNTFIVSQELECLFWKNFKLIKRILQPERGSKLNGPDKPSCPILIPPNLNTVSPKIVIQTNHLRTLLVHETCFHVSQQKKSCLIICISQPTVLSEKTWFLRNFGKLDNIFSSFFLWNFKSSTVILKKVSFNYRVKINLIQAKTKKL